MKILIIGSKGMLAHKVLEVLSSEINVDFEIYHSSRKINKRYKKKNIKFDIADEKSFINITKYKFDYIINCAGVIKPFINEYEDKSVINALKINSIFPRKLSEKFVNSKIIQITTDCVYSGLIGDYKENSDHDPTDVYGKSKSLGEVSNKNVMNIRCSIIGKEKYNHKSLISWFLNNKDGDSLNGFTNHIWNGVTTDVFAKLCLGIIKKKYFKSGSFHLIPNDKVTKYDLLKYLSEKFDKKLSIKKFKTSKKCDRSLSTNNEKINKEMWKLAGYQKPPTVKEMITDIE